MKFKSKAECEQHLNQLYADIYSKSEALDNFIYLTAKQRGKRTTMKYILHCHDNHLLGTLLRRLDPIAFNQYFNDHSR